MLDVIQNVKSVQMKNILIILILIIIQYTRIFYLVAEI